jgi:hypothetical protein
LRTKKNSLGEAFLQANKQIQPHPLRSKEEKAKEFAMHKNNLSHLKTKSRAPFTTSPVTTLVLLLREEETKKDTSRCQESNVQKVRLDYSDAVQQATATAIMAEEVIREIAMLRAVPLSHDLASQNLGIRNRLSRLTALKAVVVIADTLIVFGAEPQASIAYQLGWSQLGKTGLMCQFLTHDLVHLGVRN